MKKILVVVLAMASMMQVAGAQNKNLATVKSTLESAVAATENPKKASKPATWIKLAQSYVNAYNAPLGDAWIGASQQELAVLGLPKPNKSETVEINGQQFTKDVFENCEYYYSAQGVLAAMKATNKVGENLLEKALEAYKKAVELGGTKNDDIKNGIKNIYEKYANEAFNTYTLGDLETASKMFEAAARASMVAPYSTIDTSALYNAGFTASAIGDNDRAKAMYEECLKYGFESDNGEIYARLGDICKLQGDHEGEKSYLEQGFIKYPQSQSILIGLINYYLTNEKNTDKLFELINTAKKNEPTNASLYYVEGNIYSELGKTEEAVASYEKCVEINPEYEYGYVGEGVMFYQKAVDDQAAAQDEMDDAKYLELVKKFEADLKSCIDPFEKAFNLTKDNELKMTLVDYLKNAYYRFISDDDPKYKEGYEKYQKISKEGLQ